MEVALRIVCVVTDHGFGRGNEDELSYAHLQQERHNHGG